MWCCAAQNAAAAASDNPEAAANALTLNDYKQQQVSSTLLGRQQLVGKVKDKWKTARPGADFKGPPSYMHAEPILLPLFPGTERSCELQVSSTQQDRLLVVLLSKRCLQQPNHTL